MTLHQTCVNLSPRLCKWERSVAPFYPRSYPGLVFVTKPSRKQNLIFQNKFILIFDGKTRLKVTPSWTFRQIWCTFLCCKSKRTHELFKHVLSEKWREVRRESACVFVKGAGQSGVQTGWVGTTWFRRLVQKDSCFDLERVRYVLQSVRKYTCVDTVRNQKQQLGRWLIVSLKVLMVLEHDYIPHTYTHVFLNFL